MCRCSGRVLCRLDTGVRLHKKKNKIIVIRRYFLVNRPQASFALMRPRTSMKTENFENAFKSGAVWKRIVLKTLRFKCGQVKTKTFENGDVKSVTCHRFQSKSEHSSKIVDGLVMLTHAQSQLPVVFIVFKRFSVDRCKRYENASVDEKFFVFAELKMDTFGNALVWMGPQKDSLINCN